MTGLTNVDNKSCSPIKAGTLLKFTNHFLDDSTTTSMIIVLGPVNEAITAYIDDLWWIIECGNSFEGENAPQISITTGFWLRIKCREC